MNAHSRGAPALLIALVIVTASCDLATSPLFYQSRVPQTVSVVERPVVDKYAVSIAFDGEPRVGTSFDIRVVARGLAVGGDVNVSLQAPEIVYAQNRGWHAPTNAPEDRTATIAERRGILTPGAAISFTKSVQIAAPGYYRMIAEVEDVAGGSQPPDSTMLNRLARVERWLLITDEQYVITSEFESMLLPDSVVPAPGPFRSRRQSHGHADGQADAALECSYCTTYRVGYFYRASLNPFRIQR